MINIKNRFLRDFGDCELVIPADDKLYSGLKNVRVFSADCIYDGEEQRNKRCQDGEMPGKRCDEFVFCDTPNGATGIFVIERKSQNFDMDEVQVQLQQCANFVRQRFNPQEDFVFFPVVVAPGTGSKYKKDKKVARDYPVKFHGKPKAIKRLSVHGSLSKINL